MEAKTSKNEGINAAKQGISNDVNLFKDRAKYYSL